MGITRAIGAHFVQEKGTTFTVWAPDAEHVDVILQDKPNQTIPLQREAFGYWVGLAEDAKPGTRYTFKLGNDKEFPDPASMSQPNGVHAPSEVIDHNYSWTDQKWKNMPLEEYIIYELHTGTFSEKGTFEGIISKLPELKELGITAIELMPIAQFPGERNWGYDGVYPFATQNSYGGPDGLKKLVDACHEAGIAVVLDVVYNHFGPEGNYTANFGPYFTDKYNTPWGSALNFDDAHSDHVRNFFFQNALMWLRDFHVDALRLDAVHAILDTGAKHFLQELQEHVTHLERQQHKTFYLIAESDLNDVRLINQIKEGGYGLAAQWMDDYHHAIHTIVTGETDGYYADFGKPEHLVKTLKHSFIYNDMYSEYRKRTIGTDATINPAKQFVVCSQNHDQVGNRMLGERLTQLVSFEMLKPVAVMVLLSPYTPMLFMGEEYGEENPFQFFVSHTDKDLVEAVRKGRKEEFKAFAWQGEAPDPQSEETFNNSKLQHNYSNNEKQNQLREFYKTLIQLRKSIVQKLSKENLEAMLNDDETVLRFTHTAAGISCIINFSKEPQTIDHKLDGWKIELDSTDERWGGPGKKNDNYSSGSITLLPESVIVLQAKA